jgi:hypothetical protein
MRVGDHVYEVTTTGEASNPDRAAAPIYATGNAFSTPIVSMAVRDSAADDVFGWRSAVDAWIKAGVSRKAGERK